MNHRDFEMVEDAHRAITENKWKDSTTDVLKRISSHPKMQKKKIIFLVKKG